MRKISLFFIIILALLLVFNTTAVSAATPHEKVNVLIGFQQQPGPSEEGLIRSLGGNIKFTYHIIPAIAASVPETAIQGLSRNPRVTVIEPDATIRAIDAELDNSWGVERIGAGTIHDSGNKGTSAAVAIIDSGVDYTHPELAANYAGGYDFVNLDDDPMDDNGHGTHVAGTIAALDNDNDEGVVGVAPETQFYALKVLDEQGYGSFSNVIAALDWICGDYGNPPKAQITNNSYGSLGYPGSLTELAFDFAYELWGVLHVAAAGNSGLPSGIGDNVEYPGRFASVIAVAATDQNDIRASFSSTGLDVELAAPGVSILSTYLNHGYAWGSGTSMASPHVTGTAALVVASGIKDTNHNGFINDEVRERLIDTAYDLANSGHDNEYGWGLVDAALAAQVTNPPPPTQEEMGVSQIESGIYSGKGRNKAYTTQDAFKVGDTVVIRTKVIDNNTDLPLTNATVEIIITGPETVKVTTQPSDNNGYAEAIWKIQKPGKKGKPPGTTPGTYTASVTNVTASNYAWDGATRSTTFSVQ